MESAVPFEFLPRSLNLEQNTQRSRVSGARQVFNEMPTATLAEEILTPGEGQIKALLVIGGNPVSSIPEELKTREALAALPLCVCIDGRFTETCDYADYFLPCTYGLEKMELTGFNDQFWGKPYHQLSRPLVDAPGDADDEYLYLATLANRLGLEMRFGGQAIDTGNPPRDLDFIELIYPAEGCKVAVREIAKHDKGRIYEEFAAVDVIPAMEGMATKLRFMPDGVASEFQRLADWIAENKPDDRGLLLITRRNPHVYNSMCHEFPLAPEENPVWVHPLDIAAMDLDGASRVLVETKFGSIEAKLEPDTTLRRGVVAMTHGFGGGRGVAVNQLLSVSETTDNYTRIPQMSALPVRLLNMREC